MPDRRTFEVRVASTSNAADRGFRALADLAAAADLDDYRVVGGHMVQLLIHAYPTPRLQIRGTADADAGVTRPVAAGQHLHRRLLDLGYTAEAGNRYERTGPSGRLAVDVLVPYGSPGKPTILGDRGFDAAPGLSLALAGPPMVIDTEVRLQDGQRLQFSVLTPDVESAVVLKALAWEHRLADKDIVDLYSLFEITDRHRAQLTTWRLAEPSSTGTRKDAVAALGKLVSRMDRAGIPPGLLPAPAPRFTALVRRHTSVP